MSDVLTFTGGKRCAECDEQIEPKRVRAVPDARCCIQCQKDRDEARLRALNRANCGGRESVRTKRSTITIQW